MVQKDVHSEGCEVDIPGLNDRLQKRHAVRGRKVEDVLIQKLQNGDTHLFVTSLTEPGHPLQPFFVGKFFPGDPLHDFHQLLRHQVLEFAEGLLFKDNAHMLPFIRQAFAQDEFADLFERGAGEGISFRLISSRRWSEPCARVPLSGT